MHAERAHQEHQEVYIGRVRARIWALLAGTLMLALLLPLMILWHASAMPLRAQACVWPAAPRTDTATYLIVALNDPADRTAVDGPWAEVHISWDMTVMAMSEHPVVAHGSPQETGDTASFAVPLRLDMAGPWRIDVELQTPGRPAWQSAVQVTVLPPIAGATSIAEADVSSQSVRHAPCPSSTSGVS